MRWHLQLVGSIEYPTIFEECHDAARRGRIQFRCLPGHSAQRGGDAREPVRNLRELQSDARFLRTVIGKSCYAENYDDRADQNTSLQGLALTLRTAVIAPICEMLAVSLAYVVRMPQCTLCQSNDPVGVLGR